MKLGKLPARPGAVKLQFDTYVDRAWLLQHVPHGDFGFGDLYSRTGWSMLGNDRFGDCVWAGAAHETMLWNKIAGKTVAFDDGRVLADYGIVTGFNPLKPDTDQGTDMAVAAKYRQDKGVLDSAGNRHRIGAYLAIDPGNLTQLKLALWLFKAVGLGSEVPNCWMDQFGSGQPWDLSTAPGAMASDGGHYTPAVDFRDGMIWVVTWGQEHPMTVRAFARQSDEVIVYLSEEYLTNGKSPDGFDLAGLQKDLALVKA